MWREQAERVAESLHKGDPVLVTGVLRSNQWADANGKVRYGWEITADEVAGSLRFASARVIRPERASAAAGRAPEGKYATTPATPGHGTRRQAAIAGGPVETDEPPF